MGRARMMLAGAFLIAGAMLPATVGATVKPRLYMSTPAVGVLPAGTALVVQIGVDAPSPSGGEGEACSHPANWPLLTNAGSSDRIAGSTKDFACAPERTQSLTVTLKAFGKITVRPASTGTHLILTTAPCEWEATALTGLVALPAIAENIPLSGTARRGASAASSCPATARVHGSVGLLTASPLEPVRLEAH